MSEPHRYALRAERGMHVDNGFYCTCGQLFKSMLKLGQHAAEKAVADYLATHPSLVDLSAPETEKELNRIMHEQLVACDNDCFDSEGRRDHGRWRSDYARNLLTAWRNLRREGGK